MFLVSYFYKLYDQSGKLLGILSVAPDPLDLFLAELTYMQEEEITFVVTSLDAYIEYERMKLMGKEDYYEDKVTDNILC